MKKQNAILFYIIKSANILFLRDIDEIIFLSHKVNGLLKKKKKSTLNRGCHEEQPLCFLLVPWCH